MDEFHHLWGQSNSVSQHLMMIGRTGRGKSMLIQQRITDFGEVPESTPLDIREAFGRLRQRQRLRRDITIGIQDGKLTTLQEGPFHPDNTFFKVTDPNWCIAGENLLTLAIVQEDEAAAWDLIEQGANPLQQDKDARNPLVQLLQWENISVALLEKLVELGVGLEPGAEIVIAYQNKTWVNHVYRLMEKRQLNDVIPTTEEEQPPLKRL